MCGYYSCYNSYNCGPALTASPNSYMMEGRQGKGGKGGKGGRVKAMPLKEMTVLLWKKSPTVLWRSILWRCAG